MDAVLRWLPPNSRYHTQMATLSFDVIHKVCEYLLNNDISMYAQREMDEMDIGDFRINYTIEDLFDMLMCFIGGILMATMRNATIDPYEAYGYANCYVILDHFSDSHPCIPCRCRFKNEVKSMMVANDECNSTEKWHCDEGGRRINVIHMWFTKFKKIRPILTTLMIVESVQSDDICVMMKASMMKGSLSFSGFIGLQSTQGGRDEMIVGMIVQLIDDISDLEDDIRDGQRTWVVILYDILPWTDDQKIDWLICLGYRVLDLIPEPYNIMKMVYGSLIGLKLGGKGGPLSMELKRRYPLGFDQLIERFKENVEVQQESKRIRNFSRKDQEEIKGYRLPWLPRQCESI